MNDAARPRRVLVTGASGGIGRAVVAHLLAEGARVVATGRDRTKLDPLIATAPARVHVLAHDLADATNWETLVDEAAAWLGGLDGLVVASGIVRYEDVGSIAHAVVHLLDAPWTTGSTLVVDGG